MTPEHRQLVAAYKKIFATDEGQQVLADLKRYSTLSRPSIVPGQPIDLQRVLYDEAQRAVLLYVIRKLETSLEDVPPATAVSQDELKE